MKLIAKGRKISDYRKKELTYPDDEVMDENDLQRALLYSPKLKGCLIWVYTDETKAKLRSVAEILKKERHTLKRIRKTTRLRVARRQR